MILNEPETSLHPDLLPPLARLIANAAERSQLIVVSHAATLVSALKAPTRRRSCWSKHLGETLVADQERPCLELAVAIVRTGIVTPPSPPSSPRP